MISEHHLAVRKTARYYQLGETNSATTDVWIVCHGFGHLAAEFIRDFEIIARPGRVIVAPEGLSRFYKSQGSVHTPATPVGATWMTSEDRQYEIADYVAYLDDLLAAIRPLVSPRADVTALGFSQGAATVSRWVAASRPSLARLVLWGGLVPPEFTDRQSVGGLGAQPLHFIVGNADRYFAADLVGLEIERLKALGLALEVQRFEGGHVIDSQTLQLLAV